MCRTDFQPNYQNCIIVCFTFLYKIVANSIHRLIDTSIIIGVFASIDTTEFYDKTESRNFLSNQAAPPTIPDKLVL